MTFNRFMEDWYCSLDMHVMIVLEDERWIEPDLSRGGDEVPFVIRKIPVPVNGFLE